MRPAFGAAARPARGLTYNGPPLGSRRAAGMDRPEVDRVRVRAVENAGRGDGQSLTDGARHTAGQIHVEALIADLPGDEIGGVR